MGTFTAGTTLPSPILTQLASFSCTTQRAPPCPPSSTRPAMPADPARQCPPRPGPQCPPTRPTVPPDPARRARRRPGTPCPPTRPAMPADPASQARQPAQPSRPAGTFGSDSVDPASLVSLAHFPLLLSKNVAIAGDPPKNFAIAGVRIYASLHAHRWRR